MPDNSPQSTSRPASSAVQAAQDFVEQQDEPRQMPRVTVPHDGYKISASAESLFKAVAESRRFFYRGGAVVELVDDPARRKRMGEAARERVAQRFSPRKTVEILEQLYAG